MLVEQEDVAQTVELLMLEGKIRGDPRIARLAALDRVDPRRLKSKTRQSKLEISLVSEQFEFEGGSEELMRKIYCRLYRLGENSRLIRITKRIVFLGQSVAEVARAEGLPRGRVYELLREIKTRLE